MAVPPRLGRLWVAPGAEEGSGLPRDGILPKTNAALPDRGTQERARQHRGNRGLPFLGDRGALGSAVGAGYRGSLSLGRAEVLWTHIQLTCDLLHPCRAPPRSAPGCGVWEPGQSHAAGAKHRGMCHVGGGGVEVVLASSTGWADRMESSNGVSGGGP
jgi:hypothetical protein